MTISSAHRSRRQPRSVAGAGDSSPSFRGRHPASRNAHRAARGSSKKRDTRCEVVLRQALWARGIRYRVTSPSLPGRPDLIFTRWRVAVFCDGDFWHGRDLQARVARLRLGHNANYWVEKIKANAARDVRVTSELGERGWLVLRLWEGDILADVAKAVALVEKALAEQQRACVDELETRKDA
jgi:DNA mismatch endonuclease, patch repair protein